jgi:phage repressor protein C with HTH and peptisase S24 domain
MKSELVCEDPSFDPTSGAEVGGRSDRIAEAIGSISIREFAMNIGVSEGTLRNLIKGGEPKLDTALRIADAAGVNLLWLASGRGPKFSTLMEESPNGSEVVVHRDSFHEEYYLIDGFDITVSTGHGAVAEDSLVKRRLSFRKNWIDYRGLKPNKLKVVYAKGDSMEPTINSGDGLLVDISKTVLEDGSIFVLRLGDDLYAKRLQQRFDGGVEIISDNKEYKSQIVPANELNMLQIIGRVVWVGKNIV